MALKEEQKMERLIRILKRTGGSSIVYVRSRLESQELAAFLLNNGIPTDFYHAGLPIEQRNAKQSAWVKNQIRVMVATSAFGMGIDKPDVRAVVHMAIPESLEAYFQEAGRAGRDGKKAFAVLLYTPADQEKIKLNLVKQFPDFQRIQQIYHALCNHLQIASKRKTPTTQIAGEEKTLVYKNSDLPKYSGKVGSM